MTSLTSRVTVAKVLKALVAGCSHTTRLGEATRRAVHPCPSLSLGLSGHGADLASLGDRATTEWRTGLGLSSGDCSLVDKYENHLPSRGHGPW